MSAYGRITYGVLFEEGYEFPWGNDSYWEGIEDWWVYQICGYKNPIELYKENGEYINGERPSQEEFDLYYDTRTEFFVEHPLPIEVVDYCCEGCPVYMIVVPGVSMSSCDGDVEEIDLQKLTVTQAENDRLIEFCEKYCQPTEGSYYEFPVMDPKWHLSSYYG